LFFFFPSISFKISKSTYHIDIVQWSNHYYNANNKELDNPNNLMKDIYENLEIKNKKYSISKISTNKMMVKLKQMLELVLRIDYRQVDYCFSFE